MIKISGHPGIQYGHFTPDKESVIHHVSFLRQKKFLEGVMKQLEEDPKPVLDKLQGCSKRWVLVCAIQCHCYCLPQE